MARVDNVEEDQSHMGTNWEQRQETADTVVPAVGRQFLAHRSILEASPVLLNMFKDCCEPTDQPDGTRRYMLNCPPFVGARAAGVRLFLRCMYEPQDLERCLDEVLGSGEKSQAAVQDLLELANFLDTARLLAQLEESLVKRVEAIPPATLPAWIAAAERCERRHLLSQLVPCCAEWLARQRSRQAALEDMLLGLAAGVGISARTATAIIAQAWERSEVEARFMQMTQEQQAGSPPCSGLELSGGYATANKEHLVAWEVGSNLFDHNIRTKWLAFVPFGTQLADMPCVEYSLQEGSWATVTGFAFTSANDFPNRDPRHVVVQALERDSGRWVTIFESRDLSFPDRHYRLEFPTMHQVPATSFRLRVLENQGSLTCTQLSCWDLYHQPPAEDDEEEDPEVDGEDESDGDSEEEGESEEE